MEELFEGYVGIRLWDDQALYNAVLAILVIMLVCFAGISRLYSHQFIRMIKNAIFVKERQSLFDEGGVGDVPLLTNFMSFQFLLLSSIVLFFIGKVNGYFNFDDNIYSFLAFGGIFALVILFYYFKLFLYKLLGFVFIDPNTYVLWKMSYNSIIGLWGVLLYLPVLWLLFVNTDQILAILVFGIFYFIFRLVIISKTMHIFCRKNIDYLYINLYLCAQEIIPLILLYKGTVYLYNFIEMSTVWY